MALNLIELIKASGAAGSSGQTFRNNVAGAGNGIKMSDYRITSLSLTSPTYYDTYTQVASWLMSVNRGAEAYRIARTNSGAWSISVSYVSGGYSNAWSWSTFTSTSAGTGAGAGSIWDQSIILNRATNTTQYVTNVYLTFNNGTGYPNPQPPYSQYENVVWSGYHTITLSGSPGESTYNIAVTYDPDNAAFNPSISTNWNVTLENAPRDMSDFHWYNNYSDANLQIGPSASGYLGSGPSLLWESYWQMDGLNRTVYASGGGSGTVFYSDVSQYDQRQQI